MLDRELFAKLMTPLFLLYKEEPSVASLDLHYSILSELTNDEFEAKIRGILRNRVYHSMPLPSEILHYGELSPDEQADRAYEQLRRAIREHGDHSVEFEDRPIMSCVMALGDWQTLSSKTSEELTWLAKRFKSLYRQYKEQGIDDAPDYLVGMYDADNGQKGYHEHIKPPVFIPMRGSKHQTGATPLPEPSSLDGGDEDEEA